VKGSTLDWVEGDGNFVYLLNKINSGENKTTQVIQAASQAEAITLSSANPNNIYFWV